jgi:Flp pilus assembly pilin Flp
VTGAVYPQEEETAMRTLYGAALQYGWVNFRARIARARSGESERGASAVEWVVISMILVGLVVAVGFIISTAVSGEAKNVSTCIGNANGNNGQQNC